MDAVRTAVRWVTLLAVAATIAMVFVVSSNVRADAHASDVAPAATSVSVGLVPRFITLNPYEAFVQAGSPATFTTGFGPNAGLRLPDGAANSSFAMGFTIPPDYASGTTLRLRLLWHTPSTGCDFLFRENFIAVARAGQTHIIGPGASTGLTIVGGSTLAAPATANVTKETLVEITSPVAATPLAPGDSILFGLFRSAPTATDTCPGDMVIQSMSIAYDGHVTFAPLVQK